MTPTSIHPQTRLGSVQLNVADLGKMSAFYCERIGMELLDVHAPGQVSLGIHGRELLRLHELPAARPYEGHSGLYHFCIAVQERHELARLLKRLLETHTPLDGLVDHRTADAIYLKDPEGNGIELNWDHAKETWPHFKELIRLGNLPLDSEKLLDLLAGLPPDGGLLPPDARISHIHLHVAHLADSSVFYHEVLGFDLMGEFPRQAVFTSAGGYHHHIAFNVWNGVGTGPPPADATGLKFFTIVMPDEAELKKELARLDEAKLSYEKTEEGYLVRDPSQNLILLSKA